MTPVNKHLHSSIDQSREAKIQHLLDKANIAQRERLKLSAAIAFITLSLSLPTSLTLIAIPMFIISGTYILLKAIKLVAHAILTRLHKSQGN